MTYKQTLILPAMLALCGATYAKPPAELWQVENSIKHYVATGHYMRDIATTTTRAQRYLAQRIASNQQLVHPKHLAVVFDIDETALSNYQHMQQLRFGGRLSTIKKMEMQGTDRAIKPTLKLFNYAKKHHVKTFFITGRTENELTITNKNLRDAGYHHWTKLYLKPVHYHQHSASTFKTSIRHQIEDQGYDIVFTIGDQYSDLKGGFADREYKLVNPFYHIP